MKTDFNFKKYTLNLSGESRLGGGEGFVTPNQKNKFDLYSQ